jgi:hypothetical protein
MTVLVGPSRPPRTERTDMLAAGERDRDDMRWWFGAMGRYGMLVFVLYALGQAISR